MGLGVYGRWKGFATLGLWNLLTIIGLVVATRACKWPCREHPRGTRAAFLLMFSLTYVVLTYALQALLLAPLWQM